MFSSKNGHQLSYMANPKEDSVASVIFAILQIQLDIHTDPQWPPNHDKPKRRHENLLQLSLQCHSIQLGIHTDPSIGAHIAYDIQQAILAAGVVARIVG